MEIYENRNLKDLDGEIWKNIEGYDEDYQVSNLSRIKSFKQRKINGKILRQCKNKYGYLFIRLYKNGKCKPKLIHILIFETFNNYKLKEDECIHHIDENPKNNILNDFQLMNKSEHNSLHKTGENHPNYGKKCPEHSKRMSGKNNPNCKLENWKVKSIYQISNSPIIKKLKITQQEIADIFDIKKLTVNRIKNKKAWTNITENV